MSGFSVSAFSLHSFLSITRQHSGPEVVSTEVAGKALAVSLSLASAHERPSGVPFCRKAEGTAHWII